MKVFNCILGVFAVFGAIYCIFFPGVTFLNTGWIVTVLLGAWGVCSIFEYANKRKENKSKAEAVLGVFGLVLGISAAVFSTLALFRADLRLILDITMLYVFCVWLMISGVNSIISSVQIKKTTDSKLWVWTLVWGILTVLCAAFGAVHPLFLAKVIGTVIGAMIMLYGFRLIFSVFEKEG